MALSACSTARDELEKAWAPSGSHEATVDYLPLSEIKSIFHTNGHLKEVFLCGCAHCIEDSESVLHEYLHDREALFNASDFGKYATVYALLIWHGRAGLIHLFRQNEAYLDETGFFNEGNLEFLREAGVRNPGTIIRQILGDQYKFRVRVLRPCTQVTTIPSREILPILEDGEPRGRGDFGRVYGFSFQYDEYRAQEFRDQNIVRFARKIFNQEHNDTSGIKEWFRLLHVNRIHHDHLMPALGAFSHGLYFFILFEEASETLGTYLKSDGTLFRPEELWEQVQGLAEGLAHLHGQRQHHGPIAYHKDLKPENILIVRKVMKIADFGLLEFRSPGPLSDSGPSGVNSTFDTRAYAAPESGNRMYTRSMDVWSLGAIISEIATFELQKRDGVQRYRAERMQDMEEGKNLLSRRFHNYGQVKPSVLAKLEELRDMVNPRMQRQTGENIDLFQQQFFREPFFKMLKEMFWDGDEGCPSASDVAHRLKMLHSQALQHPGDPLMDIWADVTSGALTNRVSRANCRLCVKLLSDTFDSPPKPPKRCGLFLHCLLPNRSLLICCVMYDALARQTLEVRETFMRLGPNCPSISPDYVSNPDEERIFNVTLHQPDNRRFTYELYGLQDTLNLQAAMTNRYAYKFKSYKLESFIIPRSPRLGKAREHVIELSNAVTQLWSKGHFLEEQMLWEDAKGTYLPTMHVAILSMTPKEKLVLIKVTSEPKVRQHDSGRHIIILEEVETHELSMEKGIPMEIQESVNNYTKYKKAQLYFGGPNAIGGAQSFQNELQELKNEWQRRRAIVARNGA